MTKIRVNFDDKHILGLETVNLSAMINAILGNLSEADKEQIRELSPEDYKRIFLINITNNTKET